MSNKILILIISSLDKFIYQELYNLWKKHIQNINKNIVVRFLLSNPDQDEEIVDDGQNLYIKQEETYIHGIYKKTIDGLNYMVKKEDFYCCIRTNLSTFWNFRNLSNFIFNLNDDFFYSTNPLYTGCPGHTVSCKDFIKEGEEVNYNFINKENIFVGGTSIILNKASINILLNYGTKYNYYHNLNLPDDILIFFILQSKEVYYKYIGFTILAPKYEDILKNIDNDIICYRTTLLKEKQILYFNMLLLQYQLNFDKKLNAENNEIKINVDRIFILNMKNECKNILKFSIDTTILTNKNEDYQKKRTELNWEAWSTIDKEKIKYALILENTSFLEDNFEKVVNQSIEDANNLGEWTIIYLHSMNNKKREIIKNTKYLCNINNEGNDICAYILTLECVQNIFLKNFPKPVNPFSSMINWSSCDWIKESNGYIVSPMVAKPKPHYLFLDKKNEELHIFKNFKNNNDYIDSEFCKLTNKIFILHLEDDIERKEHMINQMKTLNIKNYEFFSGVDPKTLNIKKLQEENIIASDEELNSVLYDKKKNIYYKNKIGCSLAHWFCWKEIVKRGLDNALILEDDVYLCKDFKERVVRALKRCNQVEWNIIYLYSHFNFGYQPKKEASFLYPDTNNKASKIYIADSLGDNSEGYFITKNFIEKSIFSNFQKLREHICGIINWGSCAWCQPSGGFYIKPMLITTDKNISSLEFNFDDKRNLRRKKNVLTNNYIN